MNEFEQLRSHQYLNLETFRKNGVGVKTPVWFVNDGAFLYVRTIDNSGKVKRIRNNAQVMIAPCKVDGTPLGEWFPAMGREIKDEETQRKVDRLLDKKYGMMKKLFALTASMQKRNYTVLELSLSSQS